VNAKLPNKQQGVALITVMLIVALVAILATQMSSRLLLQMQRTTNISLNQQAYWYAMGAEAFAKRLLVDIFSKEPDTTNLSQPWAQGETTYPVDNGTITGEIFDLQACFNLNALRTNNKAENNKSAQDKNDKNQSPIKRQFIALLTGLEVDGVSQFEAEYLADALSDWLDADNIIESAGGAEDNDYAAKEFPYLTANNYLASINELRVIEHFTVPVIEALRNYVCVIPNTNLHKININTITSEQALLLAALLEISRTDAEQIIAAREEKGFASIDDFYNLPELTKLKIKAENKTQFVVDSEFFKLTTTAQFNGSYFTLNSVMKITDNNKVDVISRTIGK
jgi:general secretion pathway protein K